MVTYNHRGQIMADVSMKDFLLQYYMQHRFNNMPPEVFAKYQDYLNGNDGNGDFAGNMKSWRDKLMYINADGKYDRNELPNALMAPWVLSDDEWKKLFKAFRDAFRSMSASRDNFKDNKDATEFLNEYFGDAITHIFSNAVADPLIEPTLSDFANRLSANPGLQYLISSYLGDISYSDFVAGIKNKKYNKDTKFQGVLKDVVGYLIYMKDQNAAGYGTNEYQPYAAVFENFDLDGIQNGFHDDVDDKKLDAFKQEYKNLLNAVTRKKINDVFKDYDGGKITGQIEAARSKIDYDNKDSKDYVPPKRDDELTPLQQMDRWTGDTWDSILGKYLGTHGNRVYFSPSARMIVGAIDGAKIKPTDGLDKVLSTTADIKKGLQYKSPTANDHFDWFTKTLTELKTTMPKAFAGALKNGTQMKAIVSEMIAKAVRDGKVDQAKTALEVLSVIKYGYTTSNIMDAMRKEPLSIFSDGKLSWNKNEGMKFVTTALDKSIKAAFIGIGYGITMTANAWRLNGSKFNGKKGRLRGEQERWDSQNSADKAALIADNAAKDTADAVTRDPHDKTLARLARAGVTEATLPAKEADVARRTQRATIRRQRLDARKAGTRYTNADAKVTTVNNLDAALEGLTTAIGGLNAEITNLDNDIIAQDNEIARLDQQLNDPATFAGMPDATANAMAAGLYRDKRLAEAKKKRLEKERTDKQTERADKTNELTTKSGEYQRETGQLWHTGISATGHGAKYNAAQAELSAVGRLETNLQRYEDTTSRNQEKIDQFKEAKGVIDEITERANKRNQMVAEWDDKHKDQYKELMAYWDMLESGRDSHTGVMYKWDLLRSNKNSQKSFDRAKTRIIELNLNGYQYAKTA